MILQGFLKSQVVGNGDFFHMIIKYCYSICFWCVEGIYRDPEKRSQTSYVATYMRRRKNGWSSNCQAFLVGGWTNPIWKICSSKWVHLPQINRGEKKIFETTTQKMMFIFNWMIFQIPPETPWKHPRSPKALGVPGWCLGDNILLELREGEAMLSNLAVAKEVMIFNPPMGWMGW